MRLTVYCHRVQRIGPRCRNILRNKSDGTSTLVSPNSISDLNIMHKKKKIIIITIEFTRINRMPEAYSETYSCSTFVGGTWTRVFYRNVWKRWETVLGPGTWSKTLGRTIRWTLFYSRFSACKRVSMVMQRTEHII